MSGGGGMRFSLVGISWRENVTTNFQTSSINSITIVLRTLLVMDGDKLLVLNTRSRGDGLQT